jgi:hypothetical protein
MLTISQQHSSDNPENISNLFKALVGGFGTSTERGRRAVLSEMTSKAFPKARMQTPASLQPCNATKNSVYDAIAQDGGGGSGMTELRKTLLTYT